MNFESSFKGRRRITMAEFQAFRQTVPETWACIKIRTPSPNVSMLIQEVMTIWVPGADHNCLICVWGRRTDRFWRAYSNFIHAKSSNSFLLCHTSSMPSCTSPLLIRAPVLFIHTSFLLIHTSVLFSHPSSLFSHPSPFQSHTASLHCHTSALSNQTLSSFIHLLELHPRFCILHSCLVCTASLCIHISSFFIYTSSLLCHILWFDYSYFIPA